MYIIFSFICAVAPAVFLVVYYYKQDKAKPEPKGLIVKIFIIGIFSTIIAVILELLISLLAPLVKIDLLFYFFNAFVVAGFSEELIKLLVVLFFVFKNVEFDKVVDGIVYTVVASLGFACFENIMYVLKGGLSTAIIRAFTSIPLHALASGIMGFYIGKAKFDVVNRAKIIIKGLFIAILIHGYYDFVIFAIPSLGILPALSIIPLLIWMFFHLKRKIKESSVLDQEAGRV